MSGNVNLSTGMRNHVLANGSVAGALNGGCVRLYAGTIPADADAAIGSATLLRTYTVDGAGTGLNYESTAMAGALPKETTEVWRGTAVANGTASFWRFSALADAGGASTSEKRIQGLVATAGESMNLSSIVVTSGSVGDLDFSNITQPAE